LTLLRSLGHYSWAMSNAYARTELLIGPEGLARLEASTVAVIGLGGVGSYAAEALARAGVGGLRLVDHDCVCVTNINRQLVATRATIGRPKVEVMRERVLDINPAIRVEALQQYYSPSTSEGILGPGLSYIVDAIDALQSKVDLVVRAGEAGIPIVSAMGAGNKFDPTRLLVSDISETSICPLARALRKELRKRGVEHLAVVYSREQPVEVREAGNPCLEDCSCPRRNTSWSAPRAAPGSLSFVPSAFGLVAASVVVRALIGKMV
jgi:tRNA A37 threonylcarbamoyladenosine dehydratase